MLEGTERSRRAHGYAARIARATGATIDVFVPEPRKDEEDPQGPVRRHLEEVGVLPERIRILPERLPREHAADAVLEAAGDAQMAIVGEGVGARSDGFAGPGREVMRRATVPVLLVRRPDTEA